MPVFGNHDVWPHTDKGEAASPLGEIYFDDIFWNENATNTKLMKERFNNSFQRDQVHTEYKNFAFSYKDMNFIGLDFDSREHIPSPVLETGVYPEGVLRFENKGWLKIKLNEFEGKPVIIFSHHPLAEKTVYGFSSTEIDEIKTIIEGNNVLANFGGHIHGFDKFLGIKDMFMNANNEVYPQIATASIITTEPLMVGSNETDEYLKEHDKGIIKIVKVSENNEINYQTNEGKYNPDTGKGKEFIALNPYIAGFDYKSFSDKPCMTFYGYSFTKRENSLLWKVDDMEIGSGKKADYCFSEAPKSYQLTLQAIDKELPEIIESTTQKIEVKLGIIPKLLKIGEELKEKIELISATLSENLTEFGRTVKDHVWVKVKHSEAKPAGIITIHFEQAAEDIDLSSIMADTDSGKKKTVLYMPTWPKEVEFSKILFIAK